MTLWCGWKQRTKPNKPSNQDAAMYGLYELTSPTNFCFPASIQSVKTNYTWMKWKPSSFLEDVTPSYMLINQTWVEAKQQGNFKLFRAVCSLGSLP